MSSCNDQLPVTIRFDNTLLHVAAKCNDISDNSFPNWKRNLALNNLHDLTVLIPITNFESLQKIVSMNKRQRKNQPQLFYFLVLKKK